MIFGAKEEIVEKSGKCITPVFEMLLWRPASNRNDYKPKRAECSQDIRAADCLRRWWKFQETVVGNVFCHIMSLPVFWPLTQSFSVNLKEEYQTGKKYLRIWHLKHWKRKVKQVGPRWNYLKWGCWDKAYRKSKDDSYTILCKNITEKKSNHRSRKVSWLSLVILRIWHPTIPIMQCSSFFKTNIWGWKLKSRSLRHHPAMSTKATVLLGKNISWKKQQEESKYEYLDGIYSQWILWTKWWDAIQSGQTFTSPHSESVIAIK